MRKSSWIIALVFAAMVAPTALRASDITYAVDQLLPGGEIIGTITTNGTQGTVNFIEIDSWNFSVSDSGNIGTGNGAGAGKVSLSGIDLFATATALQFNFNGLDGGELIFPISNGGYIAWATANCQVCQSIPGVSGGFVAAVDIGGDGVADVLNLSGVQTIGTAIATPEPSTSGLMLIGMAFFAMLVGMRIRMFRR